MWRGKVITRSPGILSGVRRIPLAEEPLDGFHGPVNFLVGISDDKTIHTIFVSAEDHAMHRVEFGETLVGV